jgi:hypothetical protein
MLNQTEESLRDLFSLFGEHGITPLEFIEMLEKCPRMISFATEENLEE